jgi:hypothetical protein
VEPTSLAASLRPDILAERMGGSKSPLRPLHGWLSRP